MHSGYKGETNDTLRPSCSATIIKRMLNNILPITGLQSTEKYCEVYSLFDKLFDHFLRL